MYDYSQVKLFCCCAVLLICSACSDHGYLLQSIKGHLDLMSKTRPIDEVLAEEDTAPEVRHQLTEVVELRQFAVDSLALSDNGSYREYADLERPYVVWNMVAAPELSLKLNNWCFPIVGCVTYKGYFDEASAREAARQFEKQGFDVDVYGVQAYSTLNWFDDPVLNTFLHDDQVQLASLLFHEMAHQVTYVKNDPVFNESFAKAVELEGLRRWCKSRAGLPLWDEYQRREELAAVFHNYLFAVRAELDEVYGSDLNVEQKREAKKGILARATDDFDSLKQATPSLSVYDPWMAAGLNNARLASFATYYDLVPAFNELLRQSENNLQAFYDAVESIAVMEKHARTQYLLSLTPQLRASLQ